MLDLQYVKKHCLRLDDDFDDDYITELIMISQIYIESMVGTGYQSKEKAEKLADLLQSKLILDMYEVKGTQIPNNTKTDKITTSILDYLSLQGGEENSN